MANVSGISIQLTEADTFEYMVSSFLCFRNHGISCHSDDHIPTVSHTPTGIPHGCLDFCHYKQNGAQKEKDLINAYYALIRSFSLPN